MAYHKGQIYILNNKKETQAHWSLKEVELGQIKASSIFYNSY